VTALAGQVLTIWGDPLPDVTLSIGSRQTRTDQTGRFLLTGVPPDRQELLIDGRSANRPRRTYGVFEVGVVLMAGQTMALGYDLMPVIDTAHTVPIPYPRLTRSPSDARMPARGPSAGGSVVAITRAGLRELMTPDAARLTAIPDPRREPAGVLHDPAPAGLQTSPPAARDRLPELFGYAPATGRASGTTIRAPVVHLRPGVRPARRGDDRP
jgi:hypothetical protein